MKFAVLGLFGLLALATAYPYPSFSRYRPEPAQRYQFPEFPEEPARSEEPQATHDDSGEFKGLLNALVESMDHSETQEKEEHESYFRQPAPDRFGYSNNYNNFEDLENALSQETEQPARKPSVKAEEKLQLQSHQREILNKVEEELQKHSDAKPGSKEYDEAMEAIRGNFHHNGRVCADGTLEENCLQSACEMGGVSCPAHVEAVCVDDFCGGCNYYFAQGDKRYTREECYSTEGLEQKAFESAKEVLAQYGNDMEFEDLVKKVNERLEHPQSQSQTRFQPQSQFQPPQSQFQPPQSQYEPAEEEDEETANFEELFRKLQEKLDVKEEEEEEEIIHTNDDDITKPFGQQLPQNYYERPVPKSQNYYERPVPKSQNYYERPVPKSQDYYERPVPKSQNYYERPVPKSQNYYERPVPESAYRQRYPETYRQRYDGMSMEPQPRFGKVEMAPNRYGMNGGYQNPYQRN